MTDPMGIITPTTVERVTTSSGRYIDPPCPSISDLRARLAWQLGVVYAETGIRFELHDYGTYWNLSTPGTTMCIGNDVWTALSCFTFGFTSARGQGSA